MTQVYVFCVNFFVTFSAALQLSKMGIIYVYL